MKSVSDTPTARSWLFSYSRLIFGAPAPVTGRQKAKLAALARQDHTIGLLTAPVLQEILSQLEG